jgi:hypothetical protein
LNVADREREREGEFGFARTELGARKGISQSALIEGLIWQPRK